MTNSSSLIRRLAWVAALLASFLGIQSAAAPNAQRSPNIVLIYADDMGYADLGLWGARGYETPELDRLARDGARLTDFYVAQAVCSASRAALLTGCYSNRVGILGALGPAARIGINPEELLLPEVAKQRGYATAMFGKWHLGDAPRFLPTRHGFDQYYGLPYSNDMWPRHPTSRNYPPLPLIEGEKAIETNPDQSLLTEEYTRRAVRFIEEQRDRPFFIYLAHAMPHVPLFASARHKGKTAAGLYGDVITDIDHSAGEIRRAIERLGLARDTIIIFTSDNGPWLSYGNHAGSALPLREGKGTSWEGGVRVPFIAWAPGRIPAGTISSEPAMTIDIVPTVAELIHTPLPKDRISDGRDIWPLISGSPGSKTPHEALFFYWGRGLEAVRSGRWKLHFPHEYRSLAGEPGRDGRPSPYRQLKTELALYDLRTDPSETADVAEKYPAVVKRLEAHAARARDDLGDSLTGAEGRNVRPPGRL